MARYIDAENFLVLFDGVDLAETLPVGTIKILLHGVPTADVKPVVHAHWIITYESTAGVTDAKCSNCGYASLAYENDVHTDDDCHYCPHCGAIMDEEV